jgi:hypothetical protein
MFFNIDSFETTPRKTPSKIIHTRIIKNEERKVYSVASTT